MNAAIVVYNDEATNPDAIRTVTSSGPAILDIEVDGVQAATVAFGEGGQVILPFPLPVRGGSKVVVKSTNAVTVDLEYRSSLVSGPNILDGLVARGAKEEYCDTCRKTRPLTQMAEAHGRIADCEGGGFIFMGTCLCKSCVGREKRKVK